MKKFYMIITTYEDFKIDIKNRFKFIGFPERNGKRLKTFMPGDKVVFYISKKQCFGGIAEITGESFECHTQIWNDEYDLYPCRIPAKVNLISKSENQMVHLKDIWDNLNFIKQKHKWGVYVQGSLKVLSENDYLTIENALIQKTK